MEARTTPHRAVRGTTARIARRMNAVSRRSIARILCLAFCDGDPVAIHALRLCAGHVFVNRLGKQRCCRWLVLLIHEGGMQSPPPSPQVPSSCANFTARIASIVAGLRPEYGIVISGHTHRAYSCMLPNASGQIRS
jgi:hypothetical protein